MTDHDSIIDTVLKIIAKAESTKFEAEAEALMAKASALMAKHAIDEALLDSRRSASTDKIIIHVITFTGVYRYQHAEAASTVGHAFGFRGIRNDERTSIVFQWVGWQKDIQLAEITLRSLIVQGVNAAITHRKMNMLPDDTSHDRHRRQKSFLSEFFVEAGLRLHAVRKQAAEEAKVEHGVEETGLVLLNRKQQINSFYAQIPGLVPRRASQHKLEAGAYYAGRTKGKTADVGQTRADSSAKGILHA